MSKLVPIAAAAILLAGSLVWQAQAQTSRAAAMLGHAAQNYTPIDKAPIEQAAPAQGLHDSCLDARLLHVHLHGEAEAGG